MKDPRVLAVVLIAVAVGTVVLRIVAARRPELRGWVTLATLVAFMILIAVIGLFAWSIFGAYAGRLTG